MKRYFVNLIILVFFVCLLVFDSNYYGDDLGSLSKQKKVESNIYYFVVVVDTINNRKTRNGIKPD